MQLHRSTWAALVVAAVAAANGGSAFADGFTLTGSLDVGNGGRYGAADALLPDGRVLIAGGNNGSVNLATAVIWNPATGSFSATTNNLSFARTFPLSVTLQNGKILFVDGGDFDDETGAYANADLYDPSLGTFAATGSTQLARHNPTATLLNSGKVLVAGGILPSVDPTPPRTATASFRRSIRRRRARRRRNCTTRPRARSVTPVRCTPLATSRWRSSCRTATC